MTKALGILFIGALLGLVAWMMRSETPPADHAVQVPPVIAPVPQPTAPENEVVAPVEAIETPLVGEAIEEVATVPPVESTETQGNMPEDDTVARDKKLTTPMPEEAIETVAKVESPEPKGTMPDDDRVARDEAPGVVPMVVEENVRVASVPSVEDPMADEIDTNDTSSMPEEESITIAQAMGPLKIELPEAFFGGTPLDYWGPNLEEENYRERPEFLAPQGTAIISKGKAVTASAEPTVGSLTQLTDGDKDYAKTSVIELPEGLQWVQIDLEKTSEIYAVLVWHFHEGKRIYFDLVAQVSDDPEFKTGVTTIYNNDFDNSANLGVGEDKEYIENNQGRLIDARGVKARYLRVYGKGNTASDFNHFIEVEIWGR